MGPCALHSLQKLAVYSTFICNRSLDANKWASTSLYIVYFKSFQTSIQSEIKIAFSARI